MSDISILDELVQLLKKNNCRLDKITLETAMEDLQMGSMTITTFLMDVEDHFNVQVTDSIWAGWRNIGDMVDYIAEYQREYMGINPPEAKDTTPGP